MAEPNILLTRIDNRLIHGQVATQWNSTLGSNLILVANDEVSTNTMRQNLMKMAAPTGVQTRFFSIQKTIDVIHKASPAQKIFIVLDSPQDALKLVEGGVPIKKLNIGNMHMAEGKRQVATTVAVDDETWPASASSRSTASSFPSSACPARPLRIPTSCLRNVGDCEQFVCIRGEQSPRS